MSFILILSEKLHRTLAAWMGCILVMLYGHYSGAFDSAIHAEHFHNLEHLMLSWIEFEVIGLLLGMMIFAALLELSGFFEFLAIKATKLSKGDPWMLIVYLGTFTTLVSLIIDNVTAIIIIAPITLRMCQKLEINPIPPLLAEAILSDTGGVASMVGDPPNVMIAAATSREGIEGFGFNGFLVHLGIMTFFAWLITLGYMRYYYREWRTKKSPHVQSILEQDEWDVIEDLKMMKVTLIVLGCTVLGFMLHEPLKHLVEIEVAIHSISLAGAGIALTLAHRNPDHEHDEGFLNEVMGKVEWQALLFFVGLFILVGSIAEVGWLTKLAYWVWNLSGGNELYLAIAVIWVSAGASAIVDNIPFAAAMIPVILQLSTEFNADPAPLFWALAMGAGFGGNATPIGSSANVMTVAISERGPRPITTKEWARVGTPVMLLTCIVGTIFMVLFYNILYTSG
jgi:Na+/H+ antiporter NhaD/arsenite permease-like protein